MRGCCSGEALAWFLMRAAPTFGRACLEPADVQVFCSFEAAVVSGLDDADHVVEVHLSEGVERLVRLARLVRAQELAVQRVEFGVAEVYVLAEPLTHGHVPRQQAAELVSELCLVGHPRPTRRLALRTV